MKNNPSKGYRTFQRPIASLHHHGPNDKDVAKGSHSCSELSLTSIPSLQSINTICLSYKNETSQKFHVNYIYTGPTRWPIVGNLPHIALINWKRVWLAIEHYAQQYGDIMSLYFGPRYVVVLSNPQLVNEVFSRPEWNGRPRDHMAKVKADGNVLGAN